jgi:transcriptional regulator with XRE-family HTH domain
VATCPKSSQGCARRLPTYGTLDAMTTTLPMRVILDRMAQITMTRADLVRSSGISRTQVDRYLNGTVVPSVNAWMTLLGAVGLELDTQASSDWVRIERAERSARRAQELELQATRADPAQIVLELFLSERLA